MPKYEVGYLVTAGGYFTIEADDADEAKEIAQEMEVSFDQIAKDGGFDLEISSVSEAEEDER